MISQSEIVLPVVDTSKTDNLLIKLKEASKRNKERWEKRTSKRIYSVPFIPHESPTEEPNEEPVIKKRPSLMRKQFSLPELSININKMSAKKSIKYKTSMRNNEVMNVELELEDETRPLTSGYEQKNKNRIQRHKEFWLGNFTPFTVAWQQLTDCGPNPDCEKRVSQFLRLPNNKIHPRLWRE